MCIIAIKKKGNPLPSESIMETMFKNNSDGAGFAYHLNGKVIIQKGFMTYNAFRRALNKVEEVIDVQNTSMLFHFRIATHGGVKPALCHPFPLSRKIPNLKRLYAQTNLAIVHNGVIPIEPKGDISDTMEYIRTNLVDRSNRNFEFYRSKRQRKAILAEINSKMAFLDCNGNVYTVGEFIEDNGIMYSNSSYKERTFSFSIFDDYTSFKMLCPVDEGYIVSGGKMTECEFGQYYIDRQGRVYEYEFGFDVAFQIPGTAYNVNGMPALFDEDYGIYMSIVM